jgi:hypothetical protein
MLRPSADKKPGDFKSEGTPNQGEFGGMDTADGPQTTTYHPQMNADEHRWPTTVHPQMHADEHR